MRIATEFPKCRARISRDAEGHLVWERVVPESWRSSDGTTWRTDVGPTVLASELDYILLHLGGFGTLRLQAGDVKRALAGVPRRARGQIVFSVDPYRHRINGNPVGMSRTVRP